MLRFAFRCSLNLVKRARPRLVRGAKPFERAFAVDSDRAQKMFVGPFSIRGERNRFFATKTAAAKKNAPPIVGGSGAKPQESWVPRPDFEEKVVRNFNSNWNDFSAKSNRPNDFFGILIPGGIGVGKTRAGLEIPNIVARSLKDNDINIKVVWHLYLDYRNIYNELCMRKDAENSAGVLFSLFREVIVSKGWSPKQVYSARPITLMALVKAFSNVHNLKPSDKAVLYLHVDEFQMDPARVTTLSQQIGLYLMRRDRPNVLVILILTGVGSQEFLQQLNICHYQMYIMHLQLTVEPKWLNSLVDQFLQTMDTKEKNAIIQFREKHPAIFLKLLKTTGGIPMFIWKLLTNLNYSPEVSPIDAAQQAFDNCCQSIRGYFSSGPHSDWFHTKDNIMLLLQKAFFKEYVDHDEKLNNLTVGDLEESGTGGSTSFLSGVDLFTGLDHLRHPFKLDDSKYDEYIAQIYTFSWRLLSNQKDFTLQYLHRGCLTADKELLYKKITLPHDSIIGVEQMKELTKGSLMDKAGKYELQKPATFVVQTRQKFAGADVVIPGQVQIKWIPDGNLTEDSVKNELKKILPDMPLVIISPKVPQIALQKACSAGYYPQLCLVTDQNCIQFFEPFFTLDSTAENHGEKEIQVPNGRDELIEALQPKQ